METRRECSETLTLATAVAFATVKGVPPGVDALSLEIPHGTTFENCFLGLGPRIRQVVFYDQSEGTYTDITAVLTDRDVATGTLAVLNSMTASDRIYVCLARPGRGLALDLDNKNGNDAVLSGTYWNGTAWAALTVTDGTISPAGKTFGADGLVTWTQPTAWPQYSPTLGESTVLNGHWLQLAVSATLDTTVSIVELAALVATSPATPSPYAIVQSNNRTLPPYFRRLIRDIGAVEMYSTSLTTACNLTWIQTN